MFDTHCHLNFKAFKNNLEEVVRKADLSGVKYILTIGTDYESSVKAIEIAGMYKNVYTAVGIHPHHVNNFQLPITNFQKELDKIEELVLHKKVVAVGEVGIDKHEYRISKYFNCQISEENIEMQKKILELQMNLAVENNKSLILHNREAKDDFLKIIEKNWDKKLEGRTVFHCCEPDEKLLKFAIKHHIYIGVDGDITYNKKKQEFIKHVPLELLVLETDSPFLLPEPLRTEKKYPNEPKNISIIAEFISMALITDKANFIKTTFENSLRLFNLQ